MRDLSYNCDINVGYKNLKKLSIFNYLLSIPPRYLYLLFVDGNIGSAYKYECNEPPLGSVAAMFNALTFLVPDYYDQEISFNELIKSIHKTAMAHDSDNKDNDENKEMVGVFRNHEVSIDFEHLSVTTEGVLKLIELIESKQYSPHVNRPAIIYNQYEEELENEEIDDLDQISFELSINTMSSIKESLQLENNMELAKYIFQLNENAPKYNTVPRDEFFESWQLMYRFPDKKCIESVMDNLVKDYQDILRPEKPIKKNETSQYIKRIIDLFSNMELLHPFYDGNNRVIINILANIYLLKFTGKVAMYDDPNMDILGADQMIDKVIDGMRNTDRLIAMETNIFGEDSKIENLGMELDILKHTWNFLKVLNEHFINLLKKLNPLYANLIDIFYKNFILNRMKSKLLALFPYHILSNIALLFNSNGNNLLMIAIEKNDLFLLQSIDESMSPEEFKKIVVRLSFSGESALTMALRSKEKNQANEAEEYVIIAGSSLNNKKRSATVLRFA